MTEAQPEPTANPDAPAATVSYDFRTGTELSREALSQLRGYVEVLAAALGRIMNAYLGCSTEFRVTTAEAEGFEDYLHRFAEGTLMGMVGLTGQDTGMWWQLDGAVGGAALGRMLGGEPIQLTRRVTPLETAVLKRFVAEIVHVWTSTCKPIARCRPEVTDVIADAAGLQTVISATEIVRVDVDVEISGTTGKMSLCLPTATAQRLVTGAHRTDATAAQLRDPDASHAAQRITVPIAALVHRGTIPFARAMGLCEGDVLPLGKPLDDPLIIAVRGHDKFFAQAGMRSGRIAVRVLGPVPSDSP